MINLQELDDKEYPHIKADYREHLSQKSHFKQVLKVYSEI